MKREAITYWRRTLIIIAFALGAIASSQARPNILFILTDDQRPDSFGYFGDKHAKTPHLDRVFKEGFVFNKAYLQGGMTSAVCLPSRSMILSGQNLFEAPRDLAGVTTLPERFRQVGYTTFLTGKWHNGEESLLRSFDAAEDVFLGGAAGRHTNIPTWKKVGHGLERVEANNRFSTEMFADAAVSFVNQRKGNEAPFFLYLPLMAPHSPYTPPGAYRFSVDPDEIELPSNHYLNLSPQLRRNVQPGARGLANMTVESAREDYALYYGMIQHMDDQVGRVFSALEKSGHWNNTLIVLATDHGISLFSHGLGGKTNSYDHTSKVALAFKGPGVPKGQSSDALVYLFDVFPTVCELSAISTPPSVSSRSLVPIMREPDATVRDYLFTAYLDTYRSIRDDRYKLLIHLPQQASFLYDLANDPHEVTNLWEQPNLANKRHQLESELGLARLFYNDTPENVQRLMSSRRPSRSARIGRQRRQPFRR